ncbi:MAG: ferrochelatase [Gammaproteobacteria bacterium]|nr:ferrochelatase [Gammaproteobacteria bacterium]
MTRGILLVNLGTPKSSQVADVRRYLGEFLMDRHVLDTPWPVRKLIVSGFILPFRPKQSAKAYAKIWDAAGAGTGSPLLHFSRLCLDQLRKRLNLPTELAMRYGTPSIADALAALLDRGVNEILLVPLYPQHADSTVTTSIEAVRAALPDTASLKVIPAFYANPAYLDAQAVIIRNHLPERWDHLLLSYHGLPERHITSADPTGSHCLATAQCCSTPSSAHLTCYRHQVYRTSQSLAERLGIGDDQYSVSFQSRLGRLPWLTPYTDQTLAELPRRGVKRLVVACPAFVADNLETLEEMGLAGRETFMDAGGEAFTLVPCLNDEPTWIEALAGLIREVGEID